ncbi:MAG TPA: ATP-binding cassette domain-containing protein [Candidatus Tumulicola sp.]|nr:ATP-binding cassette domain-containing protein [Candidatus Tumulicola sp.]
MAADGALRFQDVSKTYGARAVVDRVSLVAAPGTIVAVAGANGSGKSTLFRIAAGFVSPTNGHVDVPHEAGRIALRYLSQERRFIHGLSTLDNLKTAAYPTASAQAICDVLASLRLGYLLAQRPAAMTKASVTLMLLASAYITEPAFFLADEPFAGLDDSAAAHAFAILRAMRARGASVLVSDHNAALVLRLADAVHIMAAGRIVYSGTPTQVRDSDDAKRLYFRSRA